MRKKFVWAFSSFDLIDLRTTNSAVVDADMNLTECELIRQLEFGDFERSVGLDKDGGEHGKEKPETGNLRLETYCLLVGLVADFVGFGAFGHGDEDGNKFV